MRNLKLLPLIAIFYLRKVTFSSFKPLRFGLLLPLSSKDIPRILSLRLYLTSEDAPMTREGQVRVNIKLVHCLMSAGTRIDR